MSIARLEYRGICCMHVIKRECSTSPTFEVPNRIPGSIFICSQPCSMCPLALFSNSLSVHSVRRLEPLQCNQSSAWTPVPPPWLTWFELQRGPTAEHSCYCLWDYLLGPYLVKDGHNSLAEPSSNSGVESISGLYSSLAQTGELRCLYRAQWLK